MSARSAAFALAGLPFRKNRPLAATPERIVVFRLGGMGDVINTTPLLPALRGRFPEARIDYLVGAWSAGVVLEDPNLHAVISFPDRIFLEQDLPALVGLARRIRRERYDLLLNGNKSWKYNLLAAAFGIPVRIGFDRAGEGFCNTHNVPYGEMIPEVDAYLRLLEPLGILAPDDHVRMYASPEETTRAAAFRSGLALNDRPLVCMGPGGSSNPGDRSTIRRFPAAGYAALAADFLRDCNVLLIGGPSDAELHRRIIDDASAASGRTAQRIVDVAGQLNVREVYALMRDCALYVGHSSGQTHIADAAGIPIVFINGPVPTERFAPRRAIRFVSHEPCYDEFGVYHTPTGFTYYDDIDVAAVAAAARRILNGA